MTDSLPITTELRQGSAALSGRPWVPGRGRCASSSPTGPPWRALALFLLIVICSASARLSMPNMSPIPIPSPPTLDGTITDRRRRRAVMEPSTEGLGLGYSAASARPGSSAIISSAPTDRAATSRRGCSMAGATRC